MKIRFHLLFLLLIALLLWSDWPLPSIGFGEKVLLLAILWGSVLFHELGHSLVARRLHVQVLDITFWPLGGMARFVEFPSDPKIELPIALGGPAVNFAIALLLTPFVGEEAGWARTTWMINLALGTFNLLPAFPMDGGRILRAFLGFRMGFLASTEAAVRTGRAFALLMLLGAFFTTLAPTLIVIALFIWLSGTQELWSVRLRHAARTGNPFVFWKGFQFGHDKAKNRSEGSKFIPPKQPSPEQGGEKNPKDLESFKGSLREFFEE